MSNTDVTLVDRIITRIKNHKVAAVFVVLSVGIGAVASLTKSLSEAGTALSILFRSEPRPMLFRSEPRPKWVAELIRHPLHPGVGMAGVSIGQTEKEVIAALGEPSESMGQVIGDGREIFLDSRPGTVQHYAIGYEHGGIFLGVYTDRDTRKVHSLRLMCRGGGPECKELPSFRGIAIGAPASSLKVLGEPRRHFEHLGCGLPLAKATMYQFQGLSVSVCSRNSLVEKLDIP